MRKNNLGNQFNGLFSFITGYSQSDDLQNGTDILTAYFNEATQYPDNFSYATAQDFMTAMNTQMQGDYVSLVGQTLRLAQAAMSKSASIAAVVALADSSQGTASGSAIINAVGGVGQGNINLVQAIPTVAAQTTVQVAQTAATAVTDLGTGALTALSWVKYWPYIAGAVAVFAVYIFARSEGKEVGAIHGAVKEIL